MSTGDKEKTQVVLMTAFVVDLPADPNAANDELLKVIEKMQLIFTNEFCSAHNTFHLEPTMSFSAEWIDDPEVNLGKCKYCKRLTTDPSSPHALRGVKDGFQCNGEYICQECGENNGTSECPA